MENLRFLLQKNKLERIVKRKEMSNFAASKIKVLVSDKNLNYKII